MKRLDKILVYLAVTALVLLCLATVAPADFDVTRDMLKGGVLTVVAKTPTKIGTNYTLSNPTVAPTAAQSATTGNFLTSRSYRVYIAWANLSGRTSLSPASTPDFTPPVNLKRILVTRNQAVPSGALGWIVFWSTSFDGHVVKHLCGSGGYDGQLVAPGTSTYDCQGTTTGDIPCGTSAGDLCSNQTGIKALTTFNVVGNGIIGFGSVGSTVGSALENVHTIDGTGATLKYDGAAVGQAIRALSICASGCQYTTMQAAVDANTSTASLPILYVVGPGVYSSGQTNMDGEDHATFWGAGPGSTIINCTESGAPADGCIEPGTATNWTFTGFTVNGKINASFASTGGGIVRVHDNEFIAPYTLGSHDGIYWDQPVAGSRIYIYDNTFDATYNADGTACDRLCANADWYIYGNQFVSRDPRGSQIAIRFNSIPCNVSSTGNVVHYDGGASATQPVSLWAYQFSNDYSGSGDCSGTARIFIDDAEVYVNNTTPNQGGSGAAYVLVMSTATALDELYIQGNGAVVAATDSNDTNVDGVAIDATTGVSTTVTATQIKTFGGVNNNALRSAGAPIAVWGTKCAAESGHTSGRIKGQHCGPLTDAPSACDVGDTYIDTSPAICDCSATNTWTKRSGSGSCV